MDTSNQLNGYNYASIFGLFVGGVGIYLSFEPLLISFFEMLKVGVIFYAIWFLIPLKWYQKLLKISRWEVVLFLVFVVAPMSVSLFFSINRFAPSELITKNYSVKSAEYYSYTGKTNNLALVKEVKLNLLGDSLGEYHQLRTFDFEQIAPRIEKLDTFFIKVKNGYFNFPVILEKGVK